MENTVPTMLVVKDGQQARINEADLLAWEDQGWKPKDEAKPETPDSLEPEDEDEAKPETPKKRTKKA